MDRIARIALSSPSPARKATVATDLVVQVAAAGVLVPLAQQGREMVFDISLRVNCLQVRQLEVIEQNADEAIQLLFIQLAIQVALIVEYKKRPRSSRGSTWC